MRNLKIGLSFIFLLTVTALPVYATSIITGLTKIGGDIDANHPIIFNNGLVPGAISYVDRDGRATWETIPNTLLGSDYIATENDDKLSGKLGEVYSVTLGIDAYLHVFIDQRLGTPNSSNQLTWLLNNSVVDGGFAKSGQLIIQEFTGFSQLYYNFDIWTAKVTAGTYNLGEQTGESMNGIAASAIPEPKAILLMSLGFLGLVGYGFRRQNKNL